MLRQPALTAKRTMTWAGDVNGGLDRGAAIREPGPPGPAFFFVASVWWPDMADLGRR
jgi:hypothetical protein